MNSDGQQTELDSGDMDNSKTADWLIGQYKLLTETASEEGTEGHEEASELIVYYVLFTGCSPVINTMSPMGQINR